jgi:putative toxin-antitoxin system antitoxin component (TIGR02293 family)
MKTRRSQFRSRAKIGVKSLGAKRGRKETAIATAPRGAGLPAVAAEIKVDDFVAGQEALSDYPMIRRVLSYMGGSETIKSKVRTSAEVHDLIVKGLPGKTLTYVVSRARYLDHEKVSRALGVSSRTIQRRKEGSPKPLSPEQGDRAWKFSELMVRAVSLLGSEEAAEKWFDTPAIALDQRRPIDLLGTSVGASVVGELLGRLEHGVYT